MNEVRFNDRIIKDGFPEGWYIQDRLEENVALLVHERPGMWPGSYCVCLRPKAMKTDEWLPTARNIASALSVSVKATNLTAETDIISRLKKPSILACTEDLIDIMAEGAAFITSQAETIARMERERDELQELLRREELESDHWAKLAVDDLGKNPPIAWKDRAETAEKSRDSWKACIVARDEKYNQLWKDFKGLKVENKLLSEREQPHLEEKIDDDRKFVTGYVIACCNLTNLHDEPSMAFDVLSELGTTKSTIKSLELSDYDTKALRIIEQQRGGASPYADGRRRARASKSKE